MVPHGVDAPERRPLSAAGWCTAGAEAPQVAPTAFARSRSSRRTALKTHKTFPSCLPRRERFGRTVRPARRADGENCRERTEHGQIEESRAPGRRGGARGTPRRDCCDRANLSGTASLGAAPCAGPICESGDESDAPDVGSGTQGRIRADDKVLGRAPEGEGQGGEVS